MEYKHIIYQPGKVARIILNRPRYYNAQSRLMREEMDDAFARAAEDDEVGCIIMSGVGKHFSSGHDLGTAEEMADREERGFPDTPFGRYERNRALCMENSLRWRNVPKPTIAMVHGNCIFGGVIFASTMDIIFAAEDAVFLPSLLQYFSVPWDLGPRRTKEIIFEHRFMTAWEAYRYGLVNRVFAPEKLEEETLAYAGRVAENFFTNPSGLRMVKFTVNHMQDTMGFTTEIEAAHESQFLFLEFRDRELVRDEKGGIARSSLARENLETTRPWLESMGH